jgi:hypothetical protein
METEMIQMVQNDETKTLGLYERYLEEKDIEFKAFHAYSTALTCARAQLRKSV